MRMKHNYDNNNHADLSPEENGTGRPNFLEEMVQVQEFWSGLLIFQNVPPSSDRHDNHSLNTHIYADSYNIIQLNG
jgi:hypothetical protein